MGLTVLTFSLLLRIIAIGWSVALLLRVRDGWIACLTGIFAVMTARMAAALVLGDGAWTITGGSPIILVGELTVSALMVATTAFMSRTIAERDHSRLALRRVQHDLERRVEDRTRDLRESEAKFRQLAEHIDAVFWLSDMEADRPLYVSPGFEKMFGRTYSELGVGTDAWLETVHPDDRDRITRAYRATFSGSDFDEEFRILMPDGSLRWIRDQGFIVRNEASQPHMMAGLVSDITDSKEIEEALRDSNEELEVFAQTISHDLKAPLRAMEGFAVALSEDYEDKLDERALSYLQLIAEGAARLDTLLNDLLQHASMGRSLARETVDLAGVVRRVLESLDREIDERGAIVDVDTDLPVVAGHRSLLEAAVQNLVSNAIKFVPPDRAPHVRIGVESEGATHRLYVRDNGIGIEAGHQERIFSIFERLHPRESYAGTGIGLAIVKKAARLHGGDVDVESKPGQGSVFRLSLPRHVEDSSRSREQAA